MHQLMGTDAKVAYGLSFAVLSPFEAKHSRRCSLPE